MITVALYNLRSIGNTGSILRTASFFGIDEVYMVGTTPHWDRPDYALPIHKTKLKRQLSKTALGAENQVVTKYFETLQQLLQYCSTKDLNPVALEQSDDSISLNALPKNNICLVAGPEATGFTVQELQLFETVVEIDKSGQKECLNVAVATSIAIYHFGLL
jgi:23S rRNA (guanosine2251-2'-O)-methyltransferase